MFKSKLIGKLIFKKFRVGKLINNSILSFIHEGINEINKEQVAMKFENIIGKYHFIESEAYLLYLLKGKGIPKLLCYGKSGKYKVLIEELLGKSIYLIWNLKDMKSKINDICLIALQCLDRLEYIHSKDIIHKDIKPFNFLFGKKYPELIYLIDFGISKKYRSSRTGKHIKFGKLIRTTGSLRYMSVNSNRGYEESRRDDLESLGYVLVFLLKKTLPWLNVEKMNLTKYQKTIKISKIKSQTLPEEICQGLPKEFSDYIKYTRNLTFEQDPNYNYLRHLFLDVILKNEQLPDYMYIDSMKFSWIKEKEIKRKNAPVSSRIYNLPKENFNITLSKQKNGAHKRLYRQIKDSINKARSKETPRINNNNKNNNNNNFKFDLKKLNMILNNPNNISNLKKIKLKKEEKNTNIYKKIEVNKNISFNINMTTSKKSNEKKTSEINREKLQNSIYIYPRNRFKKIKKNEIILNLSKNNNTYKNFNFIKYKFNQLLLDDSNFLSNYNIDSNSITNSYENKCYRTLKEREKEKFNSYSAIHDNNYKSKLSFSHKFQAIEKNNNTYRRISQREKKININLPIRNTLIRSNKILKTD